MFEEEMDLIVGQRGGLLRPRNLARFLAAWFAYVRVELKLSAYETYLAARRWFLFAASPTITIPITTTTTTAATPTATITHTSTSTTATITKNTTLDSAIGTAAADTGPFAAVAAAGAEDVAVRVALGTEEEVEWAREERRRGIAAPATAPATASGVAEEAEEENEEEEKEKRKMRQDRVVVAVGHVEVSPPPFASLPPPPPSSPLPPPSTSASSAPAPVLASRHGFSVVLQADDGDDRHVL